MGFSKIEDRYLNWEYAPENNIFDKVYTWDDVLEITKGNVTLAKEIVDFCDWQHPETVLDEFIRDGDVVEEGGRYILVANMDLN